MGLLNGASTLYRFTGSSPAFASLAIARADSRGFQVHLLGEHFDLTLDVCSAYNDEFPACAPYPGLSGNLAVLDKVNESPPRNAQ